MVRPAGDGGRGAGEERAEREQDGLARGVHRHVAPADDLQRGQGPGRDVQTAAATQDRVTAVTPSHQARLESVLGVKAACSSCQQRRFVVLTLKPFLLLQKGR